MLSLFINAEEKRDVAIVDVVGAYLMVDMKDKVIVKMTGDAVDIRCKVNKKLHSFCIYRKGKKGNLRKIKKGTIRVYAVGNSMVQYF